MLTFSNYASGPNCMMWIWPYPDGTAVIRDMYLPAFDEGPRIRRAYIRVYAPCDRHSNGTHSGIHEFLTSVQNTDDHVRRRGTSLEFPPPNIWRSRETQPSGAFNQMSMIRVFRLWTWRSSMPSWWLWRSNTHVGVVSIRNIETMTQSSPRKK